VSAWKAPQGQSVKGLRIRSDWHLLCTMEREKLHYGKVGVFYSFTLCLDCTRDGCIVWAILCGHAESSESSEHCAVAVLGLPVMYVLVQESRLPSIRRGHEIGFIFDVTIENSYHHMQLINLTLCLWFLSQS